jgi:penicillin-binding protein 1B
VRIHVPNRARLVRFFLHPAGKITLALATILVIGGFTVFTYFWVHYSRLIDAKLKEGPFAQTAMLFAAPEPVSVGDRITFEEMEQALRRRGYNESRTNRIGWFNVRADGVEIFPGVDAWPGSEPGVVFIKDDTVTRIVSNRDNTERSVLLLEPELITNLYDSNRQKRRLVRFADIPKVLIDAVLSAEDKRFFQHAGFDPIRLLRTIWVDVSQGKRYGASTLSMQLARGFWLTQEKTWKRKAAEALITLQIEQKLTKEEIFEYYANQVDLGRRRSFAVHGFGEASQVYFGKDIRELRLEEAALLAGLIQRPNFLNPYRHPERALQRRNTVLQLMKENGFITDPQYLEAVRSPLRLAEGGIESTDAPYFVDLVYDYLQDQFADIDFQKSSYRVYTTLDMKLQRDAVEAVRIGMKEVDDLLAKRKRKYPEPQVALVAVDPSTGEVKCLVGGRNYGMSQLNRALAKRQPGSIFKPFVYAAALSTAVNGGVSVITPVTQVMDEPTVFEYDGKEYTPNNFRAEWHGMVSLRQALAKSMNVPAVKFAEMAGFEQVMELAKNAGLDSVRATPSIALGSYEVTPLQMAGAYTVFSNGGVYTRENFIREIRTDTGSLVHEAKPERREVLDPRVAYMVLDLMQEVLRSGTGAGVRSRGFTLPAAGKTGTSHDAWFAGFTSKLLCIVWVGFDNNEELPLEGSKAALPIWTEFMKRAHRYREYRAVRPFSPPDGIVTVEIDPLNGKLATSACPKTISEVFVAGTQPMDLCPLHAGGARTLISSWDEEAPAQPASQAAPAKSPRSVVAQTRKVQTAEASPAGGAAAQPAAREQKRGFWGRIRDIFK